LGLFPMSKNVQENCVNLCADTPQATWNSGVILTFGTQVNLLKP
jgi:hypothetical protein